MSTKPSNKSKIPVLIQRHNRAKNRPNRANNEISTIIPTIANSSDPDLDDLNNGKITVEDYMNRPAKLRCSSPIWETLYNQPHHDDFDYLQFRQHLNKPVNERLRIMFNNQNVFVETDGRHHDTTYIITET